MESLAAEHGMTTADRRFESAAQGTLDLRVLPASPPQTRYQGSKLKLLPWIWEHVQSLEFDSALDAFGGSGSVAYFLKLKGKTVTYNDALVSGYTTGQALIENQTTCLCADDVAGILRVRDRSYDDFIQRTFHDVFFLDEENAWLDRVVQNIDQVDDPYKRALARYALFQACLVKRPYNLFHRANLYMRTADVSRSFGNKATWDTPFETHFLRFVQVANEAVFDSGRKAHARWSDAAEVEGDFDLVYIDPPYMNRRGAGTDYDSYYHFLDGLCRYEEWPSLIDRGKRHLPLITARSPWLSRKKIANAFEGVVERFSEAILVVSYRSDGVPSVEEIVALLRRHKKDVVAHTLGKYKYALSTNSRSEEVLVVAQ